MNIQEGMPKSQILGIRNNLRGTVNYEPSSKEIHTSLCDCAVFLNNRKPVLASTTMGAPT